MPSRFKLSNLFKVGTKPAATRKKNNAGPSSRKTLKNFMNRLGSDLTNAEKKIIAKNEYNNYLKEEKGNEGNEGNDEQNIFQGLENEVLTIEDLNRFIGDNFRDHLTGETEVIGPISKLLGDVCKRPKPSVCEYESMFSSGNGSDCLIHSFLTATCSYFRVLTQEYKNLVARSFRHHLYPTFPSTQRMIAKDPDQHNRRIHKVGAFLNDADLTNILKMYKINFIVFVSPNRDNGNVATALDDIHFPGDVYMIINRGNLHWESVRTEGSSFRISQARAENIRVAMDQFGPPARGGSLTRRIRKYRKS
jgi:hypothetical protein